MKNDVKASPFATRTHDCSDRQLDLFADHKLERELVCELRLEALDTALQELKKNRQWAGLDAKQHLREVFFSFNLAPHHGAKKYLEKAGFEQSTSAAIRNDWLSVCEDFNVAFLTAAAEAERRGGRR